MTQNPLCTRHGVFPVCDNLALYHLTNVAICVTYRHMHALIEAVCNQQEERGLSDHQLAQLLGVDGSTWSYIKAEKRAAGPKVLAAIARHFPHLNHLIVDYITRKDNHHG